MYTGGVKVYITKCSECGNPLFRANDRKIHFCNRKTCKADWQRRAKPVTEAWLRTKYLDEHMDCTQIAAIVKRDPKSVWNWLKDFGIPTRKRGSYSTGVGRKHPGRKLSEQHKEAIRQARLKDGRIPARINGVHWTKALGRHGASWKGGVTPERQAFYASPEWADAVKRVWKRDDAKCQRCGLDHRTTERAVFHIHHIDSFMIRERRAVVSNLALMCKRCHLWIHSKKNIERSYLGAGH